MATYRANKMENFENCLNDLNLQTHVYWDWIKNDCTEQMRLEFNHQSNMFARRELEQDDTALPQISTTSSNSDNEDNNMVEENNDMNTGDEQTLGFENQSNQVSDENSNHNNNSNDNWMLVGAVALVSVILGSIVGCYFLVRYVIRRKKNKNLTNNLELSDIEMNYGQKNGTNYLSSDESSSLESLEPMQAIVVAPKQENNGNNNNNQENENSDSSSSSFESFNEECRSKFNAYIENLKSSTTQNVDNQATIHEKDIPELGDGIKNIAGAQIESEEKVEE